MTEKFHSDSYAPEGGLHFSPVFRAQTGKLPPLEKGDEIVIWIAGDWRRATVSRRMAGDIYEVLLLTKVEGCTRAYLSCNTYGGMA